MADPQVEKYSLVYKEDLISFSTTIGSEGVLCKNSFGNCVSEKPVSNVWIIRGPVNDGDVIYYLAPDPNNVQTLKIYYQEVIKLGPPIYQEYVPVLVGAFLSCFGGGCLLSFHFNSPSINKAQTILGNGKRKL